MEDHAYIGELLAGIVYLIAGVRLLRLGQRTREVPERLLAAMFILSGASYIVYLKYIARIRNMCALRRSPATSTATSKKSICASSPG